MAATRFRRWSGSAAIPAVVALLGVALVAQALGPSQPSPEERIKALVVRVDGEKLGGGIIVGVTPNGLILIATAKHLLAGPAKAGDTVNVAFVWSQGKPARAVVRTVADGNLVYLQVDRAEPGASVNPDSLPLDLLRGV